MESLQTFKKDIAFVDLAHVLQLKLYNKGWHLCMNYLQSAIPVLSKRFEVGDCPCVAPTRQQYKKLKTPHVYRELHEF